MEEYKRQLIFEIQCDITRKEKRQEDEQYLLDNINKLNLSGTDLIRKKDQLQNSIITRENELTQLREKETSFRTGQMDTKIVNDMHTEREKQDERMKNKIKKYKEDEKIDVQNKKNLEKKQKEYDLEYKQKRDHRYFYKYFNSVDDTLPEYMRRNLKTMPNNKGYIWRGVWYFGLLPDETGQPLVMFEKLKGVLRIHEIYSYEHRIYEKTDKGKKLISTKQKFIKKGMKKFN